MDTASAPRHAVSQTGIVCSCDYRASRAGVEMLEAGGTCMDAAIAVAAVLNVVEPNNSHLGGDAFLLYWSAAERSVTAVNGSGAAPLGARLDDFVTAGIPERGIRAATVPGQVHAWLTAHGRWGSLPLARVLAPAIRYAEDGFEVLPCLNEMLRQARDCHDQPGFRNQFLPGGKVPASGTILRQPNTAQALRLLVRDGLDAYYRGPIGEALVRFSRELGGWFEPQDLAAHRTHVQAPLRYDYNGWTVLEQPAPSQGVITLECLALARHLGLGRLAFDDPLRVHLMIEALKAAYADRLGYWADPVFCRLPIDQMLGDAYVASRAASIDRDRARVFEPGDLSAGRDTTYFCVLDAAGNGVSFIQSVFHAFGCGVVEPTFGIVLNNRMNGFHVLAGHPNAVHPGKRPVHTLNTWMVLRDDSLAFIGGTPGGANQVQWNFQVLSAVLDRQMPPDRAVAAPRWSWTEALRVCIESDYGPQVIATLAQMGHDLAVVGPLQVGGRVQLIRIDPPGTARLKGPVIPALRGQS